MIGSSDNNGDVEVGALVTIGVGTGGGGGGGGGAEGAVAPPIF